jgi:hypothetical protein
MMAMDCLMQMIRIATDSVIRSIPKKKATLYQLANRAHESRFGVVCGAAVFSL